MADGLKTSISTNRQNGTCFAKGTTASADEGEILTGKYGKAEILQGDNVTAGNLKCGIKYTFNSSGVSDKLKSKKIVLEVTEDSILKLETVNSETSDIDNKYLPSAFKKDN